MKNKNNFIYYLLSIFSLICFLFYVYYNNLFVFVFLFFVLAFFIICVFILKFGYKKEIGFQMFKELFSKSVKKEYVVKFPYIIVIFFLLSIVASNAFLFSLNSDFLGLDILLTEWSIFIKIFSIFLFYSFFIIFLYSVGRKVLNNYGIKLDSSLSRFVFSLGISFPILSFSIFLLSLMGLLYGGIAGLLVLVLLFFSRKELKIILGEIWNSEVKLKLISKFSTIKSVLLLVIFVLLIFNFVSITKPIPISVDGLSTYFNVPNLLVKYHKYRPMMHHSAANRGQSTEMIYAFIISIVGAKYIVHFQFLAFILTLLTFYIFLKEIFGEKYAVLSMISLYFVPWNLYYASTAKVEFFLCFYLVLILYSGFLWYKHKKNYFLYLLGFFSGMAMGVKYSAVFLILPLYLVIFLYLIWKYGKKLILFLKPFIVSVFLAILLFSPWAIKNQIYFGNMFFPDKFIVGKFDTGIGGLSFSEEFKTERRREMNSLRHSVFKDKYNPLNVATTIWNQSVGRNIDSGFWLNFGFLPILVIPFYFIYLFFYRDRKFAVFLLVALSYMLFWYIADGARSWYGIFGIMMLYASLPYLFLKNKSFLFLYIFFIIVIFSGTYFLVPENLIYLSGKMSEEKYKEERLGYYNMMKFINNLNLQDEKILLTGQYKTYGINRNDQTTIVDAYYVKSGYNLFQGHKYFYNELKKYNINYIARRLELEDKVSKYATIDWLGVDLDTYLSQYSSSIPSFFESVHDLSDFTDEYTTRIWLSDNGERAIYKLK